MDIPVTQAVLRQDTDNTTCVSGLSILSLVSMLHVPLISPLCVLSQYRMCLWFVPFVSCLNKLWNKTENGQTSHTQYWEKTHNGHTSDTGSIETRHRMNKSETHAASCVSGLSILCLIPMLLVTGLPILCLVPILPESLICPSYILSQYYLCLWLCSIETRQRMDKPETQAVLKQDAEWTYQRNRQYWDKTHNGQARDTGSIGTIHYVSCNTDRVSGLSIMCLVSILHVSLVWPFWVLSQCFICLWFVHYVSCPNTACIETRCRMDIP
jgi:hypothetical protein